MPDNKLYGTKHETPNLNKFLESLEEKACVSNFRKLLLEYRKTLMGGASTKKITKNRKRIEKMWNKMSDETKIHAAQKVLEITIE